MNYNELLIRLYRYARVASKTFDSHLHDELVQQLLREVGAEKIASLQGKPVYYFIRAFRRVAFRLNRSRCRFAQVYFGDDANEYPVVDRNGEDFERNEHLSSCAEKALAALARVDLRVHDWVFLRCREGLTQEEAARRLGRTDGTLRQRLAKIIKRSPELLAIRREVFPKNESSA